MGGARIGVAAVAAAAVVGGVWLASATTVADAAVGTGDAGWGALATDAGVAPVVSPGTVSGAQNTDATSQAPAQDAAAHTAQSKTGGVTVDALWLQQTAAATGIPARALRAYASADLRAQSDLPACAIGWNTLAAIGAIESDHGRHGGAALDESGYPNPAIRGPALNGDGVAAISDTDGGAWDGDARWDRAVGPMQFIPDTWERWRADGDGDGVADPNQIDDAALAAARYLCASHTMADAASWRAAVFSYNHLDSYVDDVAAVANRYAAAAG